MSLLPPTHVFPRRSHHPHHTHTHTPTQVFVDKSNPLKVKYTLKGAVNWLPEEKFATYFTRVDEAELSTSTMATNRDRSDSARKSLPGTGMATPLMDQDIALVA